MTFRFQPPSGGDDLGPPPQPFRFPRRRWRLPGGVLRWAIPLGLLVLVFVLANIAVGIYADWLWFDSVGFRSVYRLRLVTRVWLFFAGAGVFLAFFGLNAGVALRAVLRGRPALVVRDGEPVAIGRIGVVGGLTLALFLAVIFGTQAAGQWNNMLLFLHSQSFGQEDPLFHQDIGFYVFRLPALNFILGWSLATVILTTIAVTALYTARMVLAGPDEVPRQARPHVSLLLVVVIGLFVWRYWLVRYGLVYSTRGAAFGGGYADVHAQLPAIYALMGFAALTAAAVLVSAFRRGLLALPVGAMVLWVVAAIVGGLIYPATVQRFQVEPNELARERQYIQRNIEATRAAYGLDRIEERPFPARNAVTAAEILDSPGTIQNIRLWDARPLLQTLNQIQTIRPLYDFLDVDIDRYVIDGEPRQVALTPRELNPGRLPEDKRGWVNSRLHFTHGFGLAMVPVNEVVQEGLPRLFVQDIPPVGKIEIDEPRIYYGEMAEHYVIVNANDPEFDYPVGEDETATTVYQGEGGVRLSSFLRRLVFSWELADTNILISDALNDDSRLLYRRNIRQRVEEIAPFLRLDSDPYLVVADGRLSWIQDAYTHTNRYPYATRQGDLNYVRNSVKAVVDAYDGSVTFYLVEPDDPIARAYAEIYPDLFTPIEEMPVALRAHLRYPEDLFRIQAQLYLRYHVQNATILFNGEDIWDIPTELFIDREQPVEPYYLIMRLPGEVQEEFVLILPFRPANRNNTIAWLAARSDGEQYGKLLAFRFPTETLVFGPSQVESRIDQDTTISQQISLWNQSGSQVIRGNLLMIPIGEANLFVEPIYLQATASNLPELKRVVVVNGNDIAMETTLERALQVVLGLAEATSPTGEPPGPSPAAGATPGGATPAASPQPTPTPQSTVELPGDVDALIREANDSFERAQALLQQGDFAGYGAEIERLGEILQRLAETSSLGQ